MIITGKYPNLRLRRNRKQDWIRRLVQENELSVNDLILPIFVMEGKNKTQKIKSMPDVLRYTVDKLPEFFQFISKINPFFYIIDITRFGFLGRSDGSIYFGVIYLIILSFVTWFISYFLYKKGYKIKS